MVVMKGGASGAQGRPAARHYSLIREQWQANHVDCCHSASQHKRINLDKLPWRVPNMIFLKIVSDQTHWGLSDGSLGLPARHQGQTSGVKPIDSGGSERM